VALLERPQTRVLTFEPPPALRSQTGLGSTLTGGSGEHYAVPAASRGSKVGKAPQRVALARALAAQPNLLICDEVTSALDVSVQAAVLELLQELRRDLDLSMLFITHNLGVVACIADGVLVMNRGRICEAGPVDRVLPSPADDYTRRLLAAAPSLGEAAITAPV
jgi:peptide/nickel transport system ATP-binding protein